MLTLPYPSANISVKVEVEYLSEQSLPMKQRYTFAYRITITNNTEHTLTLRRRYWHITDDNQEEETVEGEGVVGQQPQLLPSDTFVYQSGAQIKTPYGQMAGYYTFETDKGILYCAQVPNFLLSIPRTLH